MFPKTLQSLPDIPTGVNLSEWLDVFVVEPDEATNICINPSFELNTTGWGAISGGALARDTTYQRFGAFSLKYTPTSNTTDGLTYSQGFSTTNGLPYRALVHFRGSPGKPYRLAFATTGNAAVGTPYEFTATGGWQILAVPYVETSTTTRRIIVSKNGHANTDPFWIDGILLTQADHESLYFDGDTEGYFAEDDFYWTSTPHASASFRSGSSHASGRLRKITDYGFQIEAILGLGFGPVNNITTPVPYVGGSVYQNTTLPEKSFSLVGRYSNPHPLSLMRNRKQLTDLLSHSLFGKKQEMTLLFRSRQICGTGDVNDMFVRCVYEPSGGDLVSPFSAQESLNFKITSPFAGTGYWAGTAPIVNSIASMNYGIRRYRGQWTTFGTGFSGNVYVAAADRQRNRVYFGGDFITANGVTVNGICYWDEALGTFVAMGNGVAGGSVFAIAIAPNGDVWIGGAFTTVDGVASRNYVARWNVATSTWTHFGTTGTNTVRAILIDNAGLVYVFGGFTNWGGDADQDYVTAYNGTSWIDVGTSPFTANNFVFQQDAVALDDDNNIYVGDVWAGTPAPNTTAFLRKWNGTTWTTLVTVQLSASGSANIAAVERIASDFYVGGNFDTAGGVSCTDIARYNGVTCYPLGTGVAGGAVYTITNTSYGLLVTGTFTSAGGLTLADRMSLWNGYAWTHLDIDLPSTPIVYAAVELNGNLYIGFDVSGSGLVGAQNTVTSEASEKVFPIIKITGDVADSSVRWIENQTTGERLYLDLDVHPGETVWIDLRPHRKTIRSNWRTTFGNAVLSGSDFASFGFAPGNNLIEFFVVNDPASISIYWQKSFRSIDGLVV